MFNKGVRGSKISKKLTCGLWMATSLEEVYQKLKVSTLVQRDSKKKKKTYSKYF